MPIRKVNALGALPIVVLVGIMLGSTLVVSRFSLGQWQPLNLVGWKLVFASAAFVPLYLARPSISHARDAFFWRRAMVWALFGTVTQISPEIPRKAGGKTREATWEFRAKKR